MLVYNKIKRICKEKDISVAYVEKKAGLCNGLISKWNDSVPSVMNLKKVAGVLEATVDELIGDDEDKTNGKEKEKKENEKAVKENSCP